MPAIPTVPIDARVLDQLFQVIESRRGASPDSSYTASLFTAGTAQIAQKTGEEALEAVIAAVQGSGEELARESADLLYHLLVLWADAGLNPNDVWRELARRAGTSGHVEKRARAMPRGE